MITILQDKTTQTQCLLLTSILICSLQIRLYLNPVYLNTFLTNLVYGPRKLSKIYVLIKLEFV